jgi:hypothetical protein
MRTAARLFFMFIMCGLALLTAGAWPHEAVFIGWVFGSLAMGAVWADWYVGELTND